MTEKNYSFRVTAAGRVNLIGEHIDYCGGKVLPCALSLGSTVLARPNGGNVIRLAWTDLPDKIELDLARLGSYRDVKYANYPAGSAEIWKRTGHRLVGCDLLLGCSVPFGSGLSSSAAIEVSVIAALAAVAGEPIDPVEIALAAQRAEREYIGVNCGVMDQYTAACGRAGHAILLDCATLGREYIPVELGDHMLVIADCKKPHDLTVSKYNERRAETDEALRILQKRLPAESLAEVKPYQIEEYRTALPGVLYRRAKHVAEECERVRLAAEAMRTGDMKKLGDLFNRSHASLQTLYEVTGAELDSLAHAAQRHYGCLGSRMTGAGFGGCTVSLVRRDAEKQFKDYVEREYRKETGYTPAFYPVEISDGITVEKL